MTDYSEINNLKDWHRIVDPVENSVKEATLYALQHGTVDMSMIPYTVEGFVSVTAAAVRNNQLDESRIHKSAKRVLRLKQELGMFSGQEQITMDNGGPTTNNQQQALEMARDSLILTKTTSTLLPLRADAQGLKVLVTGPTSHSLASQTGGWTVAWQGPSDENFTTIGSTVYTALRDVVGGGLFSNVVYKCGTDILGGECSDGDETGGEEDGGSRRNLGFLDDIGSDIKHGINEVGDGIEDGIDEVGDWINGDSSSGDGDSDEDNENDKESGDSDEDNDKEKTSIQRAVAAAADADLVVLGLGEEPYAEKPGDIRSPYIPRGQLQLIQEMRDAYSDKPIILVYFGGRPRLLDTAPDLADAVVVAFLPGVHGGQAVVDLISGAYSPSGRLPITYPSSVDGGGVPYLHAVTDQCTHGDGPLPHWDYVPCDVQWGFGHGLSYVDFVYSNLRVSGNIETGVNVQVDVLNSGTMEASEAILIFTFDEFRLTTPEYKRLRAVEKTKLQPNQKMTISLDIPSEDFKFVGPNDDRHYVLDPTMSFYVGVGASTDCRSEPSNELCVRVAGADKDSNSRPSPACQAACGLWLNDDSHSCGLQFGLSSMDDCLTMCHESSNMPMDYASVGSKGWGWNYVNCLESVIWGFQQHGTDVDCPKMTRLCRDVFATQNLNEFGLGEGVVDQQGPHSPAISFESGTAGSYNSDASIGVRPSSTTTAFALFSGLLGAVFIISAMNGTLFGSPRRRRRRGTGRTANDESSLPSVEMLTMRRNHDNGSVEEPTDEDEDERITCDVLSTASDLLGRIEYYKRQQFTTVPSNRC